MSQGLSVVRVQVVVDKTVEIKKPIYGDRNKTVQALLALIKYEYTLFRVDVPVLR